MYGQTMAQTEPHVKTFSPSPARTRRDILNQRIAEEAKQEGIETAMVSTVESDISEALDIINFIVAEVRMPADLRAFVDAVIGTADGRLDWFESDDFTIGERIRGKSGDVSEDAIRKTAQRARKAFEEWQTPSGYTLIEFMAGGKEKGVNYATKYRAPLLKVAADAIRSMPNKRKSAKRYAAQQAAQQLCGTPIKRERFNRPRRDPQSLIARNINTAMTLLGKAVEMSEDKKQVWSQIQRQLYSQFPESQVLETNETQVDKPVHSPLFDGESVHTQSNTYGQDETEALNKEEEETQGGILEEVTPGEQSLSMLDAFESVGGETFDVSIVGEVMADNSREMFEFTRDIPTDEMRVRLPFLIEECAKAPCNLIVRPRTRKNVELVQLDDLDSETLETVRDHSFLIVETSPDNYQAWVALDTADETTKQRLRKSVKCDMGANGAVRVAGSLNVKEKYRHADGFYPMVKLIKVERGLLCEAVELERAGLLAKSIAPPVFTSSPQKQERFNRKPLPDAERFYDKAPASSNGQPDYSRADYAIAATAAKYGYDADEIAGYLKAVSPKVQRLGKNQGEGYARRTAIKAMSGAGV